MEKWRHVWRNGFAPNLTRQQLETLRNALVVDDSTVLQGSTCYPPILDGCRDLAVKGVCAIGFCGWKSCDSPTVGKVEKFFQRMCDAADEVCREPAACRYFLNWFDDTPRDEMRREMVAEINHNLLSKGTL